ncbi:MAG: hypothetical protein COS84_00900 [Armatimonadetes bacterium CG07_land_8_20_14_0_80_40_9]|nr:MAG: hypothetical protein COS84_00900 [Armatimonadetes bacterium CG07_land_8_20_14_0_80_40_9]
MNHDILFEILEVDEENLRKTLDLEISKPLHLLSKEEKLRVIENEKLDLNILGYGEISTVIEIQCEKLGKTKYVYKKLPVFNDYHNVLKYKEVFFEYLKLLKEIGLNLPEQDLKILERESGKYVIYVKQEKVAEDKIGNKLIHKLSNEECILLIERILRELLKVYEYNQVEGKIKVGIDGQISNWACLDDKLIYLDTTTPLFRINNIEQLETEVFLKNTPSFLKLFIKKFFLEKVLGRYYSLREVIVDLIANLFKEKKEEIINLVIKFSNDFLNKNTSRKFSKLTYEEMEKYYKFDSFVWRTYQSSRKIDRFFTTKILRKEYDVLIPEKIER